MITIVSFGPGKDDIACMLGTNPFISADERYYAVGLDPPKYPVPAIPVRVGYQPSGSGIMCGTPYIWVSTSTLLWTFWKGVGLYEERC